MNNKTVLIKRLTKLNKIYFGLITAIVLSLFLFNTVYAASGFTSNKVRFADGKDGYEYVVDDKDKSKNLLAAMNDATSNGITKDQIKNGDHITFYWKSNYDAASHGGGTRKEIKSSDSKVWNKQLGKANEAKKTSSSSGGSATGGVGSGKVEDTDTSGTAIINEGKNFINQGKSKTPIKWNEITKNVLPIANTLVVIATVVFVVVGSVFGVKFMISGADEKAGYKEKLIWLVIAMVLVYGATGIYNLIVRVMTSITE